MKIIHITDMHFGPYQWFGNNDLLLDRLNSFDADLIFNTGDMTTDSLEDEYQQAGEFLNKLECKNIVSIMGNHDKFSKRSGDFFRKYIYDGKFIEPKNISKLEKPNIYIDKNTSTLDNYLYDLNFVREFDIKGEKILVLGLDTCVLNCHYGLIEEEILHSLADIIKSTQHDRIFTLTHHSILSGDENALSNSKRVTDFILEHNIEANFCGHTHELDMVEVRDIMLNKTYRQFMSGTMSSRTTSTSATSTEANMYCTYENLGTSDEKITIIRMHPDGDDIRFEETVIT